MNRMANCHNQYQGSFKKVLTVCSAGLLRSPTIAWVLSNEPYNCNVRAAGATAEYALIPVDQVLIEWADEIVCAQSTHAYQVGKLLEQFEADKPVHILDVSDSYPFRTPELVEAIQKALRKIKFNGTKKK